MPPPTNGGRPLKTILEDLMGQLRCAYSRICIPAIPASLMLLVLFASPSIFAQPRAEYRAFWVDTFNTSLNNPGQVSSVVSQAKAANANALFVQVRRRGDSWYLDTIEPVTTEV